MYDRLYKNSFTFALDQEQKGPCEWEYVFLWQMHYVDVHVI